MPESRSVFSAWKFPGIAVLLVAVMAVFLFQAESNDQICLLLLIVSLAVVGPLPFRQWTAIDSCLVLITVYDVVACLYAASPLDAIYSALLSFFCLTAYFVVRRLLASEQATRIILLGSYWPVGIALLLAVCSFFIFRRSVLEVGFQDTYHFRFLFRPLGYVTNEWAEVLLILLGWICLIRRYSGVFIFLTLLAILFSFSRGAYIALGVYVIAWLVLVAPKREKLGLLAVCVGAVALTALFFPAEMKTTLQMNRTVSQQQSTEGRITATEAGWDTFKERPLFGYGNGNYTLAVDRTLNQDSTLPHTSYAPNIVIQLLIEKGVVGLLLYVWLALAICRTMLKEWQQLESRIIACTLLALGAKEMTQATLLYTPFALFMLYVLLAFLQKKDIPAVKEENRKMAWSYMLPGFLLVCFLSWQLVRFLQIQDKSYQQQSEAAWEKGEFSEAIRLMEQTGQQTSNLINRGLLYMECFRKTQNEKYLQSAQQVLQKAYGKQPEDIQIHYLQARVYVYGKEYDKAYSIIEKLVAEYPRNSLYLSALSDILYRQGDKEAAMQPLVNAIRYTPRLLTGPRIRDLQQNDSVFYHTLRQRLTGLEPAKGDKPTDYARYGYIARWCGNRVVADVYLRRVLGALPNLATPWHLLGDDRKYRLLLYGAFRKNLLSSELPAEREMTDELLFKMFYQSKFENWYGRALADYSE